ncbi:hypothetical protein FHS12_003141 [Nocardioides albus]|uniref:Uncharacterized protein n=1 Tax=Nocardioides albus TaxID=1841 RepID=A0A7W5F9D5_9ACTN|nr:hypothetical protein [Nocardioides albus]
MSTNVTVPLLFPTKKFHQFIRALRGRRGPSHPAHQPLPSGLASRTTHDPKRVAILDDVDFVAFSESMLLAQVGRDGDLSFAVQPHGTS